MSRSTVLYVHEIHYRLHLTVLLFSSTFQVEKYRPQLVKDIVGNAEAVGRLQVIAEEGNLPNVILSVSLDPRWHHKAFKSKLLNKTYTGVQSATGPSWHRQDYQRALSCASAPRTNL